MLTQPMQLTHSISSLYDEFNVTFHTLLQKNGWRCFGNKYYATQVPDLTVLQNDERFTILVEYRPDSDDHRMVLSCPNAVINLARTSGPSISISVASENRETVTEILDWLYALLPESIEKDDRIVMRFWHFGEGAKLNRRMIDVPIWSEITENYADQTCESLDKLIGFKPEDLNGQLILWRGEPGTGKTWALRALANSWREEAEFHYIVDPEEFFGNPSYMMEVLMRSTGDDKYKLLILEDSGELLAADAKDRTGQGMSRLLNAVDGILGQGIKLMVLVTTNEELQSLHPAISRDGRCAALCEFLSLEPAKAAQWLESRGYQMPDQLGKAKYMSLSELYAVTKPTNLIPDLKKKPIGFTADLKEVA